MEGVAFTEAAAAEGAAFAEGFTDMGKASSERLGVDRGVRKRLLRRFLFFETGVTNPVLETEVRERAPGVSTSEGRLNARFNCA